MKTYCTYFDSRYLTRGLALHESLVQYERDFTLYVLCLDDIAFRALASLGLKNVYPVSLAEMERADTELAAARQTRTLVEYYFTTTAAFMLHVRKQTPDAQFINYLDADLFFFSGIQPLIEELGDRSIGIIEHKFVPWMRYLTQYGIFNVGCLIFRNDDRALRVLQSWRQQCIEWCFDRLEGERYADQKYLDRWPPLDGVAVLQHKGANVAPWNVGQYELSIRDGHVFVDDQPLLFYHFHRFRHWRGSVWRLGLAQYKTRSTRVLRDHVYRPYLDTLDKWSAELRERNISTASGTVRKTEAKAISELVKAPFHWMTGELLISRSRDVR